jgi:mono/diheme cytochrome c family protein
LLAALAAAPSRAAPAADAAAGDPRRGEALFTGSARFAKGGAPCLGCHGVAGHGLARAASFGPDLSGAHEALGPEALDGALADMPFPSMTAIYERRALADAERADVIAFLRDAGQGGAPRLGARFALGVAAIAAALLLAFLLVGRRRAAAHPERP